MTASDPIIGPNLGHFKVTGKPGEDGVEGQTDAEPEFGASTRRSRDEAQKTEDRSSVPDS